MGIVKELATQLQIKFPTEFTDSLKDMLRLHGSILIMIEANTHIGSPPAIFAHNIFIIPLHKAGNKGT